MNIIKNILASIFIIVGMLTLLAYFAGMFKPAHPQGFSVEFWGIISAFFLFLGGILLLKNNIHSIWLLTLSVVCYFCGAIVPLWPQYGTESFANVMNAFYYSLLIRIGLAILAIYLMLKLKPANKRLNDDRAKCAVT